jgi:hypothetical protein
MLLVRTGSSRRYVVIMCTIIHVTNKGDSIMAELLVY